MSAIKRLIPNLFTAGNLVGGILAIIFALKGRIDLAPYFIFASAIFDFLDGFMARLLKVPSELGKQLDSLADMVTFGVAPGIFVYIMIGTGVIPALKDTSYLPYLGLIIPVFALFRLAKFNLDTRQTSSFIGLPTPAMTLFFAVMPLLINDCINNPQEWKQFLVWKVILHPYALSLMAIIFSVLMVVELPLFALKFKTFKWKGNEIRYIFLTISAGLLATLFAWAVPLIILLYIILSVINNLFNKATKDEIQS